MPGEARIGRLHMFYIDADGDISAPTWVLYGKLQGANRTGGRDTAEVKERDLDDTLVMLGHKNREITLTITKRPGDTNFDLLQSAFESGSKIGVAMMTGPIATVGEQGYQAEMYVTNFETPEEHDSTANTVTLRPCADYVTPPEFVEITV